MAKPTRLIIAIVLILFCLLGMFSHFNNLRTAKYYWFPLWDELWIIVYMALMWYILATTVSTASTGDLQEEEEEDEERRRRKSR